MPPSQLKRLKTSLRDAGVTGPSKSKKQKKSAKTPNARHTQQETLQQLRDSFNPFELRATTSRPAKHQHVTNGPPSKKYKDVLHRPGVTKSAGEEMRRAKLLPELQRRNKVGGLVDRRIGEEDMALTPEERAVQRFAAEKGRKRGKSVFDLEGSDDEDGAGFGLTHGGRALDDLPADDFGEETVHSEGEDELIRRKRRRSSDVAEDDLNHGEGTNDEPDRKKTKKEVMQEVIAKSKLHKYERQKVKEDDDDLLEQLDMGMDDVLSLLRNHKMPVFPPSRAVPEVPANGAEPMINPERQKLLDGMDRAQVDREYDVRLKQLAQDAKAKPSDRTKTDEEKVRDEAERLKNLEERRLQRMKGEDVDEPRERDDGADLDAIDGSDLVDDEAAEFGLAQVDKPIMAERESQLVLEDEDEFALDDDLIASGSDIELSDDESVCEDAEPTTNGTGTNLEDEEEEFVKGILGDIPQESGAPKVNGAALAYTYPCPSSHAELLEVIKDIPLEQLPTIIQRIRALYHPSLKAGNKEATAEFSSALVEHLSYMGLQQQPLRVTEQVIRHLHSLSRTYPDRIANAFRAQLQSAHERKDIHAGDLIVLTAIGSIYPTSDHWHQVVTPAMTLMARGLAMNASSGSETSMRGATLVALCLHYQRLSKRVIPEALRFTLRALHLPSDKATRTLTDHVENLMTMAELWKDKTAFTELFTPALAVIKKTGTKKDSQALQIMLQQARLRRRPLELHHHRPLPIRTSVPKFEEGFNPDKHYDPDKDRSDSRKLQQEYRRERKGAIRELRKDANFIARESLKEKKERDREYERSQQKLLATIQTEAGRDENEYQRERKRPKNKGRK